MAHRAPKIVKVEQDYAFNVSDTGRRQSGDRVSATVTPEGENAQPFSVTLTPGEFGKMRGEIAERGWTLVPTGNPR